MRSETPMASQEDNKARESSARFATIDSPRADRAGGGEGGTDSSPAPISATSAAPRDTSRDPLTDPRAGDIVVARDGGVIEVVDVVLGRDATVWVREDSSRYAWTHATYREVVAGGRVVHRAEGQA